MNFEDIKTAEDLKAAFPGLAEELTAQTGKAAAEAATKAERERIAGIDALAIPGFEDIIAKAKAEGTTPGDTAMQIIAAQKRQGMNHLADTTADVTGSNVNNVPAAGSEKGDGAESEGDVDAAAREAVALWKNSKP